MVTAGNYFRELAFAWYWGNKNRPTVCFTRAEPASAVQEIIL